MRFLAILGAVLLATGVVAAMRTPGDRDDLRETVYVFGTLVEIVIRDAPGDEARAAMTRLARLARELHRDWHAWQPGMLTSVNEAIAEGRTGTADARLATLLRKGRQLACESGGLFDPAIGDLIGLWGFHADTPPEGAPPSAAEIAALVEARPRMTELRIDGTRISSTNPALQLDLGGFAKGAALDLMAETLKGAGIANAVLNAGGDVNVMGTHGDRPWRVAIRDPFVWGAVAAVSLRPGEVLYTSGNYERYFEHDGQRFAHIIDPRTGYPVREIVSVSVLGTDGTRSDAAATALSVAGRAAWPQVAAAMGTDAVLMIADDGAMFATPAMRQRLEPVSTDFPAPITTVPLPDVAPPACHG